MPKGKMTVFGYARVSTENQIENYSIDEQVERLKSYCAAKGWVLLKTYIDGGYSGGNTDRPALQQMLHAIHANKIDAVVVYKLDRLSRSQKDTLTLIEDEFLASGTDFVSISENFDTSTPFGRAMIGILSVFAQLEKDQITERFTMGRIARTKAGYFSGGNNPPTGYDYRDGLLQVNEYDAAKVQEVFELFLSGKTINYISKHHAKKYQENWSATKVAGILRNTVYIGKVHFAKLDYDGIHQPIISEKMFYEANRILNSSERAARFTTAQKTPFRAGYLLSSIVYCKRCGARYSANHGFYKCYSRAKSSQKFIKDPNCKNDNWPIQELDDYIIAQVDAIALSSDVLKAVIEERQEQKRPAVDRKALKKQIANIDNQIAKLIDLYQVGSIPLEIITEKANELSAEKAALQEKLDTPEETPALDIFINALESYRTGFKSADMDHKRMLISSIIEKIEIDGRSVEVHWRL